jgi:thioesterase domain-containing protein
LQALQQNNEIKKNLYIIAGRQGVFTNLFEFTQGLAKNIVTHVVPMPQLDEEFQQPKTISDLGQHVADFISRQTDVEDEIHLLGFSFGARVASEAGCILQKNGFSVSSIVACDMGPAYGKKQPLLSKPHLLLRMIQGKEQFRSPSIVQRWHVMDKVILEKLSQYLSVYALKNLRSFMRLFCSNDRMAIYESLFLLELAKKNIVSWQPLYFNGTLTVFVAEEGVSTQLFMPKDLGWGAYAANVQVVRLHGGHLDYMHGAGLVTFLEHINTIVGRAIIH